MDREEEYVLGSRKGESEVPGGDLWMLFRNGSCEREGGSTGTVTPLRTVKITRRASGGIRKEVRNQQEIEGKVKKLGENQEKGQERKSIRQACFYRCCRKFKEVTMRSHATFKRTPTVEK